MADARLRRGRRRPVPRWRQLGAWPLLAAPAAPEIPWLRLCPPPAIRVPNGGLPAETGRWSTRYECSYTEGRPGRVAPEAAPFLTRTEPLIRDARTFLSGQRPSTYWIASSASHNRTAPLKVPQNLLARNLETLVQAFAVAIRSAKPAPTDQARNTPAKLAAFQHPGRAGLHLGHGRSVSYETGECWQPPPRAVCRVVARVGADCTFGLGSRAPRRAYL
jgi:hypothetical protein